MRAGDGFGLVFAPLPDRLRDVIPTGHDASTRLAQSCIPMELIVVGLSGEFSLRLASGFDDRVAGFEGAAEEPVGAEVPPDGLDRVQLGRAGRREDSRGVARHIELGGGAPSSAIEQQRGVGAFDQSTSPDSSLGSHFVSNSVAFMNLDLLSACSANREDPRASFLPIASTRSIGGEASFGDTTSNRRITTASSTGRPRRRRSRTTPRISPNRETTREDRASRGLPSPRVRSSAGAA